MNLGKWTQIAEIVSSIAVLATLGFLLLEVRENTAVTRSEAYGESVDRLNFWRLELANNPELTRLFTVLSEGRISELTTIELQQFYFLYGALWGIYEASYYSRNYNILGDEEWERFKDQICFQYSRSIDQQVWVSSASRMSAEFTEYVSDECGT